MKALVFGARGWLGSRYVQYLQAQPDWTAVPSAVDIGKPLDIADAIETVRPDLVINAAGKTHSASIPNIDGCVESREAQRRTFEVNAVGAGHVATACQFAGVKLIHLASGCIFNGDDRLFTEADPPNPVSWYAKTKAMGDQLVQGYCPSALILRIRMPISAQPHPRNLITKLAGASTVIDVVNSVTVVEDLLPWSVTLAMHGVSGIVHAVHPQPLAFRVLMRWYTELVDPSHVATFIPPAQYRTTDGRSNCVLTSARRDVPVVLDDAALAVPRALKAYAKGWAMVDSPVRVAPRRHAGRFWTDWIAGAQ